MELIFRAAALAVLTSVIGLLLKNKNPEITMLLGAATAVAILLGSFGLLDGLQDMIGQFRRLLGSSEILIAPLLKASAIGIVTHFTGELCRDSSQRAAASAVEMAGTICALSTVVPLLTNILKIIGGLT